MRNTLFANAFVCAAATTALVLIGGGIASAHVEADPIAMQAGSSGTVAFNVEHGCDGSPMTDLKIQIPDGVTNVKVVDKAGWTGTVTATTIEFTGGSLPADKPDHFDVTLTVPTQAGEIHFPAIETCVKGELAWIEIPADGVPEPEFVAPTLKITAGPPTSAELTPSTDAPAATTVVGGTVAPVVATVVAPASSTSSSNTGTVVVVIVVVAVVLIGGGVVLTRRRGSATKT
jgi:uncharacterized protein YcnI